MSQYEQTTMTLVQETDGHIDRNKLVGPKTVDGNV